MEADVGADTGSPGRRRTRSVWVLARAIGATSDGVGSAGEEPGQCGGSAREEPGESLADAGARSEKNKVDSFDQLVLGQRR